MAGVAQALAQVVQVASVIQDPSSVRVAEDLEGQVVVACLTEEEIRAAQAFDLVAAVILVDLAVVLAFLGLVFDPLSIAVVFQAGTLHQVAEVLHLETYSVEACQVG